MAIDYSAFSSNQSEAMKQFKAQYGRSPTSSEIEGWTAYNAPKTSASSTAALSTSSDGIQQGFGGRKQWDVLSESGLYDVKNVSKLDDATKALVDENYAKTNAQLSGMKESIDRLSAANASMLKGEIPADVSAAVRRAASESSISGGVFGTAARNLSARDLGKTSYDIRQQGVANETGLNEARANLATAHENIRQYSLTRAATLRELEIKASQSNMTAVDLERQRIATNISANVDILANIASLVQAQQATAVQASSAGIDPSGLMSSFDNWIKQFSAKLS